MKKILIASVAVLIVLGVFGGSVAASVALRKSQAPSASPVAATTPRPASCHQSDIWGMRKAPDGAAYWACTRIKDGSARFYDATLAQLGGKVSKTLRCGTAGKEGDRPYVDCTRIPRNRA